MPQDPYSVLGVSPGATDDEIRQAYRDLARKYHPDNYKDHPLASLAEEKMKEINEAYDAITKMRKSGGNYRTGSAGGYGSSEGTYTGSASSSGDLAAVRSYIQSGNLAAAEQLLSKISDRNAEWYFLNGSLNYRKGWYDEARRNFETAYNMEPGNMEYRTAYMRIQNSGSGYNTFGGRSGSDELCNCCGNLMCADCLCEACGGNLCPCLGCR